MSTTPGPWSVITLSDGYSFIANEQTKVSVCLAPEAPLVNGAMAWPDNSRLICAAPDLLEALEDIVADIGPHMVVSPLTGQQLVILRKGREAIAKATGAA